MWDNYWAKLGAAVTVTVAVLSALWGGLATFDATYVHAAAYQADMRSLQQSVVEGQKGQLEREEYDFQVAKKKRPLTELEQQRMESVQKQIRTLDKRIEKLGQ